HPDAQISRQRGAGGHSDSPLLPKQPSGPTERPLNACALTLQAPTPRPRAPIPAGPGPIKLSRGSRVARHVPARHVAAAAPVRARAVQAAINATTLVVVLFAPRAVVRAGGPQLPAGGRVLAAGTLQRPWGG